MRFIHLSDLHLGIRLKEYSLIEDQKYILKEIVKIIKDKKPDAVIVSGDVYDKTVPSAEAIELLDEFIFDLSKSCGNTFIISGNHDSAERLSFGNRLIERSGVYICPAYNGYAVKKTVYDDYGAVNFYMLPFVKPANVRRFFPDEKTESYNDALKLCVDKMQIDKNERNVLITHQFVTGAKRSESEEITVGGADNVDAEVFDAFNYVALGHIHSPQKVKHEKIRYCGTPLKYSFSETEDKKSVSLIEMNGAGEITVEKIPLKPLRDLAEIRGTYDKVLSKDFYEGTSLRSDFVHVTLTDENDIPNALANLRVVYKNLLKLDYDNKRTRASGALKDFISVKTLSPKEIFSDFYKSQNNQDLSDEQDAFMSDIIDKIWGGENETD